MTQYPTNARMTVFDFQTNTVSVLWFDTRSEALKYWNSKRENIKLHFLPIEIVEVAR